MNNYPGRVLGQNCLKTDLHLEKSANFPYFQAQNCNNKKKTGVRENQPKIDLYSERLAWQKCTMTKIILTLLDFKNQVDLNIYIGLKGKGAITLYKELKMLGFWRIFLYN